MALKKILVQNLGRFQQLQSGDTVDTAGLFATGTTLAGLADAPSITGFLAQPVAGTAAGRVLTGTAGNISITNGDGTTDNPVFDLVNAGTAVTDQFVRITTDAKGRVTATAAVSNADVATALGYTPVNKAGDTDVGSIGLSSGANLTVAGGGEVLGLPGTPTTAGSAASKAYVDGIAAGVNAKEAVRLATVAALPSVTPAGSGVGHTLTATANGALSIDGTAAVAGDRVLIKNQTAADDNGVYVVTDAGSASTAFILTRATDFDGNPSNEVTAGDFVYVLAGSTLANTGWIVIGTAAPIVVDTDDINWTQYTGTGSVSIIFAASSGPSYTALSGSTVTIAGTANQITATGNGTGTITLALPQDIHTGASPTFVDVTLSGRTANQILYAGAGGAVTSSSAFTYDPTVGGAFTVSVGYVQIDTGSTERFRILADGAWSVGSAGTDFGTSGQALVTNGSGSAPTWQTIALGNTTGTLPINRGGTGQTTQVAAFDALSPATNLGDIIVHNGTNNVRLPVGTNGQVLMADSGSANGIKWASIDTAAVKSVMTNTQGSTITIGQAVYVASAGNVQLADADAGSGAEVVLGFVGDASIADTASGNIVSAGEITTSGLTAGAAYYLSETAGAITTTAPTATGSWVVPVGIALSTTRFLVRIGVAFQN